MLELLDKNMERDSLSESTAKGRLKTEGGEHIEGENPLAASPHPKHKYCLRIWNSYAPRVTTGTCKP